MLKGIRKFAPALALAGALVAAGLPGGSAKAQNVPFSSGFQVQNLESVGANISMAFFAEGGTNATANVNATVPANDDVTFATLPSQVANGFRGSAVISSDQRIAAIVNLISPGLPNINLGSSYVGVTGGSTTAALPLIFKNYFGFSTFFSVQNVGSSQAANVTVTYAGAGLSGAVTETATIQPGASVRFDQLENDDLPDDFVGSVIVTATGSEIAAVATQYDAETALSYNGFAAGTTEPYFPLVQANNFGSVTGISLQNLSDAPTNVTIEYVNSADGETCTETKTIPARDTGIFALNAFSGAQNQTGEDCANGATFIGSGRVTTNSGNAPLVVIVNQLTASSNKAGAYSSFDAADASNTVVFPLIMDRNFGFFTGISVVNVSDVATTITCTYSGITNPQTSETVAPGEAYVVVHQNQLADKYVGSGRCVANATGATIVGIANQISAATTDTLFVYEGVNN
jgi:hypothetical protein